MSRRKARRRKPRVDVIEKGTWSMRVWLAGAAMILLAAYVLLNLMAPDTESPTPPVPNDSFSADHAPAPAR